MKFFTSALFPLTIVFETIAASSVQRSSDGSSIYNHCKQNSTDITQLWGPYSPFFSVPSEIPSDIPEQCRLTLVQVLSRHGARDPTASKTAQYSQLIARIKTRVKSFEGEFTFLANYTYTLGADQLTSFGQQEMVASGVTFYNRYQSLTRNSTPFFRSSGEGRVVESAENFTQGFHQAKGADICIECADNYPYPILVVSEAAGVNNTLAHSLCIAFENSTAFTSIAPTAEKTFLSTFAPPITVRLNAALPGANLSITDTLALMDLCPFDTVAARAVSNTTTTSPPLSPFCALFTASEWANYDYFQSLNKFYGFGPGNPLGPTQGVGFVNELLARLTNSPVQDHTSTNHTLDASNATFPLGVALYADFSHDSDMTAIFSALGLYNNSVGKGNGTEAATAALLSTAMRESLKQTGSYSASVTVPFAARAYFEKMVCGDGTGGGYAGAQGEEMVRVIVNDRVLPLVNFGADSMGLVPLGKFVGAMSFAKGGGKWDKCFA